MYLTSLKKKNKDKKDLVLPDDSDGQAALIYLEIDSVEKLIQQFQTYYRDKT